MVSLFSNLTGKVIVLTGGTGYFGPYFCRALLEAGARIIVLDRADTNSAEVKMLLEEGKDRLQWKTVDFYDEAASRACLQEIVAQESRIDGLVNNAFDFSIRTGFNDPSGCLEMVSYEQLKAAFDSGIYWAMRATQILGVYMKKQGHGAIVNVGSMYGVVVPSPDLYEGTDKFNPPGYSMAKAGLLQFTKYSASFLSPAVRVNAISPGAIPNIETKTFNAVTQNDPIIARLTQKILLKRMGHPKDLIGGMVFLLSDSASYITGQNILIDGGLTVT